MMNSLANHLVVFLTFPQSTEGANREEPKGPLFDPMATLKEERNKRLSMGSPSAARKAVGPKLVRIGGSYPSIVLHSSLRQVFVFSSRALFQLAVFPDSFYVSPIRFVVIISPQPASFAVLSFCSTSNF